MPAANKRMHTLSVSATRKGCVHLPSSHCLHAGKRARESVMRMHVTASHLLKPRRGFCSWGKEGERHYTLHAYPPHFLAVWQRSKTTILEEQIKQGKESITLSCQAEEQKGRRRILMCPT